MKIIFINFYKIYKTRLEAPSRVPLLPFEKNIIIGFCFYFLWLLCQPFRKKINLNKNLMLIGRRVVLPSEGEESLLDSFQAPADISQQWGSDESEITTASHEIHTKVEKLQICAVQSNHYLPLYSSQFKNHIIYCVAPLCRARPGCCNHETLISLHTKYRSNMYVFFCSFQRQFLQLFTIHQELLISKQWEILCRRLFHLHLLANLSTPFDFQISKGFYLIL